MARITVVLPVYNAKDSIRASIESIKKQTFNDWELLAINEFGSNDESRKIIEDMSHDDSRIHLIQNESRLGLAESLNKGIRMASGDYIARLDADDTSVPERFDKQIKYLDSHPHTIVLGGWQQHYGRRKWIHKASTGEKLKANLLFYCDMCHSTVMMRKDELIKHSLFYDPHYYQEDQELWTRVFQYGTVDNIPEVLGDYKEGSDSATDNRLKKITEQSGILTAKAIKQYFYVDITEQYYRFYDPVCWRYKDAELKEAKRVLRTELTEIAEANTKKQYCSQEILLDALFSLYQYEINGETRYHDKSRRFQKVDQIFDPTALAPVRYLDNSFGKLEREIITKGFKDLRSAYKVIRGSK